MEYDYQPPVARLLTLGFKDEIRWDWPDYLAMGLTKREIPELIRMATDERLNNADGESAEVWAPLHAWRALGQLEAEEAIEPLLTLLELDDDRSREEIPVVMEMIGSAAIPHLDKFIDDNTHEESARIATAHALEKIGNFYPEQKQTCINILIRHLQNYQNNPPSLNAFFINYLIDLEAVEAAPVMEKAYAAKRVDLAILGDWENAQIALGLLEERITPERNYLLNSLYPRRTETIKQEKEHKRRVLYKKNPNARWLRHRERRAVRKGKRNDIRTFL